MADTDFVAFFRRRHHHLAGRRWWLVGVAILVLGGAILVSALVGSNDARAASVVIDQGDGAIAWIEATHQQATSDQITVDICIHANTRTPYALRMNQGGATIIPSGELVTVEGWIIWPMNPDDVVCANNVTISRHDYVTVTLDRVPSGLAIFPVMTFVQLAKALAVVTDHDPRTLNWGDALAVASALAGGDCGKTLADMYSSMILQPSLLHFVESISGLNGCGGIVEGFSKLLGRALSAANIVEFANVAFNGSSYLNELWLQKSSDTWIIRPMFGSSPPPPAGLKDGTLIQRTSPQIGDRVYRMDAGRRRWIPSPEVMASCGWSFANVIHVSQGTIDAIPPGPDQAACGAPPSSGSTVAPPGATSPSGSPACASGSPWHTGQRVQLRANAPIRAASTFSSAPYAITFPDGWQVDIIGGPRCQDGGEWWNVSRQALDGGGTGWTDRGQSQYQPPGAASSGPPPVTVSPELDGPCDGTQAGAYLYADENFNGRCVRVAVGHDRPNLANVLIDGINVNDWINSIRLVGVGYLRVCEDSDGGGKCLELSSDKSKLSPDGMEHKISSLYFAPAPTLAAPSPGTGGTIPPTCGTGELSVEYFPNKDFAGMVDRECLPYSGVGAFVPRVPWSYDGSGPSRLGSQAYNYSVRVQGLVFYSGGRLRCTTESDDGSRVYLDGVSFVDNWGGHARQARSGAIDVTPGFHLFQMDYDQEGGAAYLDGSCLYISTPTTAPPSAAPPTAAPTSAPPTATPTSAPPTATRTSAPPTATPTSVPPAATPTSAPPTSTPTSVPLVGNVARLASISGANSAGALTDENLSTTTGASQHVTFTWSSPVPVHRVIIWNDRSRGGINWLDLRMSDGTDLRVDYGGPNECVLVDFGARTVASMDFDFNDHDGGLELREIEIWATSGQQSSGLGCGNTRSM